MTASESGTGGQRTTRLLLVVTAILGGAVLVALSTAAVTATHEPILYGTDSGLNVTDASGGSIPNGTPFPDDETVDLPGITLSASDAAAVTVDQRNGTTTNLSAIDPRRPITVDPDDKQAVVVVGGLDSVNFSVVDYGAETVDLSYTASTQPTLRLNSTGLPSGTEVAAVDTASDSHLAESTVASNGSLTFTDLPTGSHDVTLTKGSENTDADSDDESRSSRSTTADSDSETTVGANRPEAVIVADSQFITTGTTVGFEATRSTARGTTSYQWDFDDDGAIEATGSRVSHTFTEPGSRTVRLAVQSDQSVGAGVDTLTVEVRNETAAPQQAESQNSTTPSVTASLVPSARNLRFGGSNGTPPQLALQLRNPLGSTADVRVRSVDIVGPDSDQFSVVSGDRGSYTLAPGQSQRLEVQSSPTERGFQHAQLRIHSDADTEPQLDVWLSTTPTVVLVDEQPAPTTGSSSNGTVSVEAHNVDDSPLSVNVSTPTSRTAAATIESVTMTVRSAQTFRMNVTHATDPQTVGAVPYEPVGNRTVLQHIELTHTIPNDQFSETAVVYRVDKDELPPETTPVEVVFRRYANGEWTELTSSLRGETERHYVYTVDTDGFSQFLVTGPTNSATASDRTASPTDSRSNTVGYLLAALLVGGTIGSGILVYRSRQDDTRPNDPL